MSCRTQAVYASVTIRGLGWLLYGGTGPFDKKTINLNDSASQDENVQASGEMFR